MDKKKVKQFSLRIDGDILAKFHNVCEYQIRSANSQIIQLMRMAISDYEKEHGKIILPESAPKGGEGKKKE